jgi:hypothetical protein
MSRRLGMEGKHRIWQLKNVGGNLQKGVQQACSLVNLRTFSHLCCVMMLETLTMKLWPSHSRVSHTFMICLHAMSH